MTTRSLHDFVGPVSSADDRTQTFRLFLLVHVATSLTLSAFAGAGGTPASRLTLAATNPLAPWALAAVVALVVGVRRPHRRSATALAAAVRIGAIVTTFPHAANHHMLEAICLVVVALFDDTDEAEADLCILGLRWVTIIVLFHAGLQKVLYGFYFDGTFMAVNIAIDDRYATAFRPFMPAEDFTHLRRLADPTTAAQPYTVGWPGLAWISNFVWIAELALVAGLLLPATRSVAAALLIVFLVVTEIAVREVLFGVLFVQLAATFLPLAASRWITAAATVGYVGLIATRLALLPGFRFN